MVVVSCRVLVMKEGDVVANSFEVFANDCVADAICWLEIIND